MMPSVASSVNAAVVDPGLQAKVTLPKTPVSLSVAFRTLTIVPCQRDVVSNGLQVCFFPFQLTRGIDSETWVRYTDRENTGLLSFASCTVTTTVALSRMVGFRGLKAAM